MQWLAGLERVIRNRPKEEYYVRIECQASDATSLLIPITKIRHRTSTATSKKTTSSCCRIWTRKCVQGLTFDLTDNVKGLVARLIVYKPFYCMQKNIIYLFTNKKVILL